MNASSRRGKLRELLVRGLDCFADVSMRNHEATLAIQHASEAVRLEPFRESGYQRLMQAHAMLGNRAEVRRVYERCRTLLREEVGLNPSPELEALYQTLQHQPSSVNPGG